MIQIKEKADCCGCSACASICKHDAIMMKPDVMGFLYPVVDESKCVDCGLCDKVCAFNDHYDTSRNLPSPDAYAARHKDISEVETSRSGAAFIAISDYILENGGVVYGAGYTDHFRVVHKRATTKEERDEFKGSKYVQSDLRGVFRQVKKDLKEGLTVLFSGTPCQTAGLNSYIGKHLRENLLLVDIVCHGVPAPSVWRDYLHYLEKKYNQLIIKVNFRDKSRKGWSSHIESYLLEDNTCKESTVFTDFFFLHIMLRPSCGKCFYTNVVRPSDFTIGDFWGWEKTDANFNKDNKGCSLLFCNTRKSRTIFEQIKANLCYVSVEIEKCIQPNLQSPTKFHPEWKSFERAYERGDGFSYVATKYGIIGWKHNLKFIIKKVDENMRKIGRRYIKKTLKSLQK